MRTLLTTCLLLVGCAVLVTGCGPKASTDEPMDQVRADASTMSAGQLTANAKVYKTEIGKCQAQLADQTKALMAAPPLGEESRRLAQETQNLTGKIGMLRERLQVYLDELMKKGQDITNLKAD